MKALYSTTLPQPHTKLLLDLEYLQWVIFSLLDLKSPGTMMLCNKQQTSGDKSGILQFLQDFDLCCACL